MMHIPSLKSATKNRSIEDVEAPELLVLPLLERFGARPVLVVEKGDPVRKYQPVAEASGKMGVKLHSPVSGTVVKIEEAVQVDGTHALSVFIRNDKTDRREEETIENQKPEPPGELLRRIGDAGLVGLGGAQFPVAVKYDRKEKPVKTFIINGAECEPYLTTDFALLSQHTAEVLEGILIADTLLEAEEIVIAVENANRELAEHFKPWLGKEKYRKIRLEIVPDEYPQGGELQLSRTVTGIEIPKGTVPLEKGIIVSNVGTLYSLYEAVMKGKPLTRRVITVSGPRVNRPGNYRVPVGTPVSELVERCGIDPDDSILVAGGPMMSPRISDLSAPVHKGMLGIVALPRKPIERMNCIWCGYCVDVCPMRLMPMKYEQFYRRGKYAKLAEYNLGDCIECGACEYICPSNVPLIESIKEGKNRLKAMNDAAR